MGAWSHEPLGNDDAGDWVADLVEGDDLSPIEAAFDDVLDVGDDYVEAPEASAAIAAAEAVARLQGNFGTRDAYSEGLDEWVKRVALTPSPELSARARQALDRILGESSELAELWDESDESAEWRTAVQELRDRIDA